MLRLIFGRAGSGKSHYIKEKILQTTEGGGECVLIVPEQSSFDRERELLGELGERLYSRVSVFSFTRLSQRLPILHKLSNVSGDTSINNGQLIDMFGKIMLMSRTLGLVRDKLKLYARQIGSTNFMQQLLTLFAEFKGCRILPEHLLSCANRMKPCILKQKLGELYEIYSVYSALLAQKYVDAQDMLEQLAQTLKHFDYFNSKTVFVDSFKNFTYQEQEILRLIMRQSKDLYVSLCTDKLSYQQNDETGLFYPCVRSARSLINLAKSENVSCAAPVEITGSQRFKSAELSHLEQGLFNIKAQPFGEDHSDMPQDDSSDSISYYGASGSADEVEFAARNIKKLTEQGMRYRDIAIIARDIEQYEDSVESIFARYDIPVFLDKRTSVECTPLFFLVLSALDIASIGFDSDCIFKFLKSGLTDISAEEINELENYTLIWSINGKQWLRDFHEHPKGLGYEKDDEALAQLERLNDIRKRVIEPLYYFREKCKNASGRSIAEAVYDLLIKLKADEAVRRLASLYSLQGDHALSEEQNRLWELLIDILDSSYEILADEQIELSVYIRMVRAAIALADLGHIPQTLDSVCIGSAERIKPFKPKAVFILGANDEVFPKSVTSTGLFNENERQTLEEIELSLDFDLSRAVASESFLVYQAVTCASHRLFVSYQSASLSGEPRLESSLIIELRRLFPKLKQSPAPKTAEQLIFNDKTAFSLLAKIYNQPSALSSSLQEHFKNTPEYGDKLRSLETRMGELGQISENQAQLLFDSSRVLSSSRLETFYRCRYKYLCNYGLNLKKRESGQIDSRMFGTILHYCLEKLLSENTKQQLIDMPPLNRNTIVSNAAIDYCNRFMGGLADKPKRFCVLFERWINNCKLIAAHVINEISGNAFTPRDFELKIGRDIPPYQITLDDGSVIKIVGMVDRVDTAANADKSYLRIIDYKSGKKQFKLSSIIDGLDMQMLIYMFAIIKGGSIRYGKIIPAGVLYMQANVISNSSQSFDEQKVLAEYSSKLRMNGLLLEDKDSVMLMEYDGKGEFIPLSLDKDGEIKKYPSNKEMPGFTPEQLELLEGYISVKIKQMAQEIKSGRLSPDPIMLDSGTVCDWCDYKAVCSSYDIKPRQKTKLSRDDCYALIKQSLEQQPQ